MLYELLWIIVGVVISFFISQVIYTKTIKDAYWQGEKVGFEAGVKKMERKYANNKKTNFKSKSL